MASAATASVNPAWLASTYAGSMHVVVVDDEQRMVTLIAGYLEEHQVTTVELL